MLSVEGLHVSYGSVAALRGVSIEVAAGEIVAVIGPNGAGKSTLLRSIAGLTAPARGQIRFDAESIGGRPAERLVAQGLSLVPEGRRIFGSLSVAENITLGATPRRDRQAVAADLERMLTLFPILRERFRQKAGKLSGGEQQMLAIARALMSRPRLLLLDEPSLGLAPLIVKQIFQVIREINQQQRVTVFLVEQNAFHALKLAHRGYVMINGKIALSGTGTELLRNAEVRAAYLEGGH